MQRNFQNFQVNSKKNGELVIINNEWMDDDVGHMLTTWHMYIRVCLILGVKAEPRLKICVR